MLEFLSPNGVLALVVRSLTLVIQNIPNVTPQFNKIAREHGFKVANKSGSRVKDLTTKAKTPLGDKNSNITYNIPCGCSTLTTEKHIENGERERKNTMTKCD